MHNADRYGLNAHEEIPDLQDLYARPFFRQEDLNNAFNRIHEKATDKRVEIEKQKLEARKRVKRNYKLGGTAVGAGLGYLAGRKWANKTPIISQQRKRKIIGTALGAAGGFTIGTGLGNLHNSKLTNPKFDKLQKENQEWEDHARKSVAHRYERRPRIELVGRTNKIGPQVEPDYTNEKFGSVKEHLIKKNITEYFKSNEPIVKEWLKQTPIEYPNEKYEGKDWKKRRRILKKQNKLFGQILRNNPGLIFTKS